MVTGLYLKVKRVKMKPLQQIWASKCLLLRDQAKLFTEDVPLGPILALRHPISSSIPSIFAGKACSYSDKSDNNNTNTMISIAYEPDVRWLLVRTGKPSAEHWQEERDCKLKLRSSSTSLFPGTAAPPPVLLPPVLSDSETTTASSDCREEKFPCTRLYSVHKPVKQCISYLCVTSVRRMYVINKEVCTRVVCKENEVMQDEICRQLAGLPPRRLRRSGQPLPLPCRQLLEQQRRPGAL
uniref:Microfibril associated protein 5 n=1 Tax=Taeniopygia guttata TaxID=59729 RepID=A0A674GHD4_TAEGU